MKGGVLLGLLLLALPGVAAAREKPRFLTPPSSSDAAQIVRDWLGANRAGLGLEPGDADDLVIVDRYVSRGRGTTHLDHRQRLRGIEVFNGNLTAAVAADGRMLAPRHGLAAGLARRANADRPRLSAEQAAVHASAALAAASAAPVPELAPRLVYLAEPKGALRLAWHLVLRTPDRRRWGSAVVDATSGQLLFQNDWMKRDAYRVLRPPLENPEDGPRTLEVDPADPVASPFGWHDTNGVPGAEFDDTTGNPAWAQEDADADDLNGFAPDGGPARVFDFAVDLSRDPSEYQPASVANLFYLTSWLHDLHYGYGFDEPAGNFQQSSYGNGGLGGDAVIADAQDGADENNAGFLATPDGLPPRMEMYLWTQADLTVSSPPAISGTYPAGRATFGAVLTPAGLTGALVQALDPANASGPSTTDGCSPLTNPAAVTGKLALIDRGTCFFVDKVANAQAAGAIGVVIANNVAGGVLTMGGSNPSLVIPALFISRANGNAIKAQLGSGVGATLSGRARDGSLDTGIVVHEYGHGVSTRLTGGPSNPDCLADVQSGGMGEGWSDWWALALTAKIGDSRADERGIASYLLGEPPGGPGIRNFRYSTDLAENPLTYGDVAVSSEVHDVGEIWAVALWELYWNLVGPHGFDPDASLGIGGNNLALQLVLDGLKLQPCDPTFLDARDAILAADLLAANLRDECRIWTGFAKRGMGINAQDGGSAASQAVTPDFELPVGCKLCGDVGDEQAVDLLDAVRIGRALDGLGPPLVAPEKCNTSGPADLADPDANGIPADCDAADLAALRQQLSGLSAIPPVCAPAVGLFP